MDVLCMSIISIVLQVPICKCWLFINSGVYSEFICYSCYGLFQCEPVLCIISMCMPLFSFTCRIITVLQLRILLYLYPKLYKSYLILSYLILDNHNKAKCIMSGSWAITAVIANWICFQGKGLWPLISIAMMTSSNWNILRVTGPLCEEFTGHRWIPRTKASDAELWCFLWSAPE